MKPRKIFLNILILVSAFQIGFAQEKPQPVLSDEDKIYNCEWFTGRIDIFFDELRSIPSSVGYVVLHGEKQYPNLVFYYRELLKSQAKFRTFDLNRLQIVRGAKTGKIKFQFWIIPNGADLPNISKESWNFASRYFKPFIFIDESMDSGLCDWNRQSAFNEVLTENPNIRGYIVIKEESYKKFLQRKKNLAESLSSVPANCLKFSTLKVIIRPLNIGSCRKGKRNENRKIYSRNFYLGDFISNQLRTRKKRSFFV